MPAPISVLIPTLNARPHLGPTLASLFPGLGAGLIREVILADGGSTDGTCAAAEAAGARVIASKAGRGTQLAAGAAAARGDWLLVLHADTRLEPGWEDAVAAHLAAAEDRSGGGAGGACGGACGGGAGWFRLRFDAPGMAPRLVAGWANLRARALGLPYGDQGLLLPMSLYRACGGYPDIPLMEDVVIARALRGRLRPLPATVTTSAARYLAEGWLRRGWRNLTTLALFFAGRDPVRLAERYRR